MSVLGQVLRSLHGDEHQDANDVRVQLERDCRHARLHMQGLERQHQQLSLEIAQLRRHQASLQQQQISQEQATLQALADGQPQQAHLLATALAEVENQLEMAQQTLARRLKQQAYYQQRSSGAERHYHDLCRQLTMANNTACVRKTLTTIRQHHSELTPVNAKQALTDIRARERQQAADAEPDVLPSTAERSSTEQVLARLKQRLEARS
ncbi:hypothetical protein [Oceanisphaera sp.]|uniref:hypothetical protein n=1 Tax=Oceanisphaera sp. TaxID=1929979 RepID=UPI003A8CA7FD